MMALVAEASRGVDANISRVARSPLGAMVANKPAGCELLQRAVGPTREYYKKVSSICEKSKCEAPTPEDFAEVGGALKRLIVAVDFSHPVLDSVEKAEESQQRVAQESTHPSKFVLEVSSQTSTNSLLSFTYS